MTAALSRIASSLQTSLRESNGHQSGSRTAPTRARPLVESFTRFIHVMSSSHYPPRETPYYKDMVLWAYVKCVSSLNPLCFSVCSKNGTLEPCTLVLTFELLTKFAHLVRSVLCGQRWSNANNYRISSVLKGRSLEP